MTFDVKATATPTPVASTSATAQPSEPSPVPPPSSSDGPKGTTIALWVATGVFAAGAITTGVVAQTSSSKLTDLKKSPTATRDDLDKYHDRMRTFAVTSDILTGVTVLTGAAALYVSLSPSKPATATSSTGTRLGFGVGSMQISGAF